MNPVLTVVLAAFVLFLFCYLYCPVIVNTLRKKGVQPADRTVYLATALAGLIGSVTAMNFEQDYNKIERDAEVARQKLATAGTPVTTDQATAAPPAGTVDPAPASPVKKTVSALGNSLNLLTDRADLVKKTKVVYAYVYLLTGLMALVAWAVGGSQPAGGGGAAAEPGPPPQLVTNLALITLGLVISILKSFLAVPTS